MRNKFLLILISFLLAMAPSFAQGASIDEMIGQMVLVGFKGNDKNSAGFKKILSQIDSNQISGVVFLERNIKNRSSLEEMTKALLASKSTVRPFISIDEEGGIHGALGQKNGFEDYPSAQSVSKLSTQEAYKAYYDMAQTLSSLFFNLNLAPCVDLDTNKYSMVHKKQSSFSQDNETVIKYANEFVKAHYDNNIITSLKHFPGYGSAIGDKDLSHVDVTNTTKNSELLPYENILGQNNIQTVMVSHMFNKNRDAIYPASLSYYTVYGILRKQMDYNGVIIADSLDAPSLINTYNLDEIVVQAINAGCDILYFSNSSKYDPSIPDKVNKIIKAALIEGQIEPLRIEESYKRIIKLKQSLVENEKK